MVDVDADGSSRVEAIEALKAQFLWTSPRSTPPVDQRHWLWERWDVNGDGYLTRDEPAPRPRAHCARALCSSADCGRRWTAVDLGQGAGLTTGILSRRAEMAGTPEREEVVRR